MEKKKIRNGYGDGLKELGKKRKDVVVLDADLSGSTRSAFFAEEFPDRFFNSGIAEQDMMGMAAGLALSGKTVFASTFAMFATGRAYDQVRNTIAYSNAGVNIVASHAGITVGPDGSSHQPLEDVSLMRNIPNMKVVAPADYWEARKAVSVIADLEGPVYMRTARPSVPVLFDEDHEFRFGEPDTLREGDEVAILSYGVMVNESLKAAEKLEEDGVDATVINMSTLKPMDRETVLKAAKNHDAIVTAEEHTCYGGLGDGVSKILSEEDKLIPMRRVAVQNRFGQSGEPWELLEHYELDRDHIAQTIIDLME